MQERDNDLHCGYSSQIFSFVQTQITLEKVFWLRFPLI